MPIGQCGLHMENNQAVKNPIGIFNRLKTLFMSDMKTYLSIGTGNFPDGFWEMPSRWRRASIEASLPRKRR